MLQIRLLRNVRLGIKNLLLHKLRSLLTVLGLVFGVGSVIAMLAVGEGASQEALDKIRMLGSNNIIISSIKPTSQGGGGSGSGSSSSYMLAFGLLYEDEARISETLPGVKRTVPVKVIRKRGQLGELTMDLRVVGTSEGWFDLVKRNVLAGRMLTHRDMDQFAHACVLTEYGARKLLAGSNTIGQPINIGEEVFEVVGIVRSEHGGEHVPDLQADVYIPITTFRERYGDIEFRQEAGSRSVTRVELHKVLVEVKEQELVKDTAAAVKAMLLRFHQKGDAQKPPDYHVHVPLALLEEAEDTKRRFNIVLGSIAGISLLVGGIGIMNIMLASVTERTREIGIRRAIGARRGQIVGQFLIETTVLSTIGGLIGIGVGVFFPWLVEHFAKMPTIVPMYSIVLSLGISMGVGILFGIYPAIRASMLDPIEALRHE